MPSQKMAFVYGKGAPEEIFAKAIPAVYGSVFTLKFDLKKKRPPTFAAGDSQSVSFSITKEDAGSYSVAVDELSGSFTVIAPAPPAKPINRPALGIVSVVVVGLLIFFLIRRRAY